MIGVFDSGYGGLTVFRELDKKFPKYDFIYFGDNARAPYGSRSSETIYQYTEECVDWLFRERKVLGVLIPVAEAVAASKAHTVGILATEATVKSEAYIREIHKISPDIKIIQQAAPLLVPLIEAAMIYHSDMSRALKKYLNPFKTESIQNIVLGCTHYPFIKHLIQAEMPDAKIFDSPSTIPAALENYFSRHPEIEQKLSKNGARRYITTGNPENFEKFVRENDLFPTATSPRVEKCPLI